MWYEPDAACGVLEGPLELPAPESGPLDVRVRLLTQQIADRMAAGIARHPEDWHMLQRLWLDEPGRAAGAPPPVTPSAESSGTSRPATSGQA
jgi:KDO2-lipid IV(A) lauroyltransferase